MTSASAQASLAGAAGSADSVTVPENSIQPQREVTRVEAIVPSAAAAPPKSVPW